MEIYYENVNDLSDQIFLQFVSKTVNFALHGMIFFKQIIRITEVFHFKTPRLRFFIFAIRKL